MSDAPDPIHPPPLTEGDPIEGRIRAELEDFVVDEIPAYSPSGEGDHLFVRFEKRGLDTPVAVKRIAAALDANPRDAGYAGLKDRHAITTQWASFAGGDPAKLEGVELEDVRVLEAARHTNKLRTGHLHGNRFSILLEGAPEAALELARARAKTLVEKGMPAYFGPQRFGRDGGTLEAARAWLVEGGRAPREPFRRKLFASAWQSAAFNDLLARRVVAGLLDAVVPGDLARKEETGGLFVTDGGETDQARAAAFEVSATGPLFGPKMRWPEGEAAEAEREALARAGLDDAGLARMGKAAPGGRRPYRVRPSGVEVSAEPRGLRFAFTLPSGSYATVFLKEITLSEHR